MFHRPGCVGARRLKGSSPGSRCGGLKRYGHVEGRVRARLLRELGCIEELGFAPYFLLAREAAEIAREKGDARDGPGERGQLPRLLLPGAHPA